MEGKAALVTGGAAGIGLGLVRRLVRGGCAGVTVVDLDGDAAREAARGLPAARVLVVEADVTDPAALTRAFDAHRARFGRLDACFANAGGDPPSAGAGGDDAELWRKIADVNFVAAVHTVRLAVAWMRGQTPAGGAVVITCSASAPFAEHAKDIEPYASAKAGAVHYARSLGHLRSEGVVVAAVCPQFAPTAFVRRHYGDDLRAIERLQGRLLAVDEVVGLLRCTQPDAAGRVLVITARRGAQFWAFAGERARL